MHCTETKLEGVFVFELDCFNDERGHFLELWNEKRSPYANHINTSFVQDNLSHSRKGVLRGLHFQNPTPQAKLVTVLQGKVWDVAVDIRRDSPTFGEWYGLELSGAEYKQLFIPEGFAHGFVVLSETALFHYKCSAPYNQEAEKSIVWNDPELGIEWPVQNPILSVKDAAAPPMNEMPASDFFF